MAQRTTVQFHRDRLGRRRWALRPIRYDGDSDAPCRDTASLRATRTVTRSLARDSVLHLEPWVMLYSLHGGYIALTLL